MSYKKVFNPLTKKGFDNVQDLTTEADERYVNTSGDTMIGDLNFPEGGFVMTDSSSNNWTVTVNTSGELVISVGAVTSGILTEDSEFLLTEGDYNLIQE